MVYTANRQVVSEELAQHAEALCCDCAWASDDPLTVRSDAVEHVRKTKHDVKVELHKLTKYRVEK